MVREWKFTGGIFVSEDGFTLELEQKHHLPKQDVFVMVYELDGIEYVKRFKRDGLLGNADAFIDKLQSGWRPINHRDGD